MTQITTYKHNNDLETLKSMAVIASKSGKYPDYNESTILNIFLTSKALGIDPMIGLNGGFHLVKGKIIMGAHFMAALIRRKGHSLKVIEMTTKKCVIIAQRKDNGDSLKYEYTWEEAEAAGLTNKDNYKKHAKQMLYARCVSCIFRILFPDMGMPYDEDEMNLEDEVGSSIEVSPMPFVEAVSTKCEPIFSDDMSPMSALKERLSCDDIDISRLDDYIDGLSKEKQQKIEQIIESAMLEQIYEKFKIAYGKYLMRMSSIDSVPA